MKIIFMGTPEFAVPSLQYLLNSEHQVVAVFTQPDRKQGRGQKVVASPVKLLANKHSVPVFQPETLKNKDFLDCFLQADVVIVIAYGLLLPLEYLRAPKYGCLNIHASLLPRWRGAAPIQRAIAAGDKVTGVCLMQMDQGLDTGPVFLQKQCTIANNDTSVTLSNKLSVLGVEVLISWFKSPEMLATDQIEHGVKYAKKITKDEGVIDFNNSFCHIYNCYRAFDPWPGVGFYFKNLYVKVHTMELYESSVECVVGSIVAVDKTKFLIQAQDAVISITMLQLPNKKKVFWQDFYCGLPNFFTVGEIIQ